MNPIPNGTFTISSPTGEHRTVRIRTIKRGKLKGARVVELLTGADNGSDFTGFAFFGEGNEASDDRIIVWRKKSNGIRFFKIGAPYEASIGDPPTKWQQIAAALADLLPLTAGNPVEPGSLSERGFTIEASTTCIRCNRKLTHPDSIRSGMGPDCEGRDR